MTSPTEGPLLRDRDVISQTVSGAKSILSDPFSLKLLVEFYLVCH